jgi:hypothetical protein
MEYWSGGVIGFSRMLKASNTEAVSTAFLRVKLLKQFVVSTAAYTGLKPGVNGNVNRE